MYFFYLRFYAHSFHHVLMKMELMFKREIATCRYN